MKAFRGRFAGPRRFAPFAHAGEKGFAWLRLSLVLVLLLAGCLLAGNLAARGSGPEGPLGSHYLLLVAGFNPTTFTPDKIAQFDQSPYQGLAVVFLGTYETAAIPSAVEMKGRIREWQKGTKKDLWPWLFLNRMVGPDPGKDNPRGQVPYYARIKGMDLDGSAGAQKDFLEYWQNSLQAAKDTGAPGIFIDMEFYLNYAGYSPVKLAAQMGRRPSEVAGMLRQLGAKMAGIAAKEHPRATLWFLFSDLFYPDFASAEGQAFYPSPAYIVMGLLDEIQARHYSLRVISGGEVALSYCHTTLDQLKLHIRNRARDFQPAMEKYGQALELGGTLAPWLEKSKNSGWMKEGYCGKSSAETIEELQPYLETLFLTYRYNWVYATDGGNYYPFHPRSAPRFDAVIQKAIQNAYGLASR